MGCPGTSIVCTPNPFPQIDLIEFVWCVRALYWSALTWWIVNDYFMSGKLFKTGIVDAWRAVSEVRSFAVDIDWNVMLMYVVVYAVRWCELRSKSMWTASVIDGKSLEDDWGRKCSSYFCYWIIQPSSTHPTHILYYFLVVFFFFLRKKSREKVCGTLHRFIALYLRWQQTYTFYLLRVRTFLSYLMFDGLWCVRQWQSSSK